MLKKEEIQCEVHNTTRKKKKLMHKCGEYVSPREVAVP